MLSIEDFGPVTLRDREIFREHHAGYPPAHSENTFITLFAWSRYVKPYYLAGKGAGKEAGKNTLAVMTLTPEGEYRFRPPTGPGREELARDIVGLAERLELPYPLVLVDDAALEWLAPMFPGMRFIRHRDYFDYVYLASDLAGLPGKNYLKIRSKINRFRRQYEYTVETLCRNNLDEARNFLRRWCLWRDCESDTLLDNERMAVQRMMEHCFDLGLEGLALRIDGEMQAVAAFEPMSEDTAVVHFEKAMPDFEGLYQVINQETARYLAPRFRYINRQSDLGIEGLRTAKRRYHPHHMVEVRHMTRKSTGEEDAGHEIY